MARPRSSQSPSTRRPQPSLPQSRDVVQGLKLQVRGRELAVRLGERIRWHRARGDALIAQMKKLGEIERDAADELENVIGQYESPRIILDKKLREHQERASFLTFLRDHIAADDTYRLDSTDLRMTEILPDKPW